MQGKPNGQIRNEHACAHNVFKTLEYPNETSKLLRQFLQPTKVRD